MNFLSSLEPQVSSPVCRGRVSRENVRQNGLYRGLALTEETVVLQWRARDSALYMWESDVSSVGAHPGSEVALFNALPTCSRNAVHLGEFFAIIFFWDFIIFHRTGNPLFKKESYAENPSPLQEKKEINIKHIVWRKHNKEKRQYVMRNSRPVTPCSTFLQLCVPLWWRDRTMKQTTMC